MTIEWRASFPLGLRGAQDALTGLRLERSNLHGLVGSAVFWICAVDEQLRALSTDPVRYEEARDTSQGRCIPGLRLARNGLTHGAAVVVTQAGLTFPLTFPMDFGPSVWEETEAMLGSWVSPPQRRKELRAQIACYSAYVSRRLLADPIEEAIGWLSELNDANYDVERVMAERHPPA